MDKFMAGIAFGMGLAWFMTDHLGPGFPTKALDVVGIIAGLAVFGLSVLYDQEAGDGHGS